MQARQPGRVSGWRRFIGRMELVTFYAKIVRMLDDERLERILDAAYTCFTRHGVRRTTMSDIAKAAEMSRPGVYQYVRNKQEAFRRLAARLLDASLADARSAAASETGVIGRLTRVLEAKLRLIAQVWQDSPAHADELLGAESRQSADLVEAYDAAMCTLLASVLTAVRPDLDDAEASETAVLLLAFTRGLEADLADPHIAVQRLHRGIALFVAGLDHPSKETS
jgi:AcrR family transcriptional regulator